MFVEGAPGTKEPRRPTPPHHIVDGSEFGRLCVLYETNERFMFFTPTESLKNTNMQISDDEFARWFSVAEYVEINGVRYEFNCLAYPNDEHLNVTLERKNAYDKWGAPLSYSRRHGSPVAVKAAFNLFATFAREWMRTPEAEKVKESTLAAEQAHKLAYLYWQREALQHKMRGIDKELAEALGHDLSDLIDIHHDLSNRIHPG